MYKAEVTLISSVSQWVCKYCKISSLFPVTPVWKWKYVTVLIHYNFTLLEEDPFSSPPPSFKTIRMTYFFYWQVNIYLVSAWKSTCSWCLNMLLEYAWLKANFTYIFKIHMGNQIFRPRALDVSKTGNFALSLYECHGYEFVTMFLANTAKCQISEEKVTN